MVPDDRNVPDCSEAALTFTSKRVGNLRCTDRQTIGAQLLAAKTSTEQKGQFQAIRLLVGTLAEAIQGIAAHLTPLGLDIGS